MLELTKSTLSYSWAMSLFGVQQAANLFMPRSLRQPFRRVNAASYSVTQATENQFDDLIFGAYQVGDETQRFLVDLIFDTLTLRAFTPSYVYRLTSEIAAQSEITLSTYSSADSIGVAWRELRNNYEVFNLVKNVSSLLNVPSEDRDFNLGQLIEEAYALGAYPDLWAVEGLGHDYAMLSYPRWGKGERVSGILTDERASVLPSKSLTMMHAGLGLAFAQQLLNRVTPYSPAAEIRNVLSDFIRLVQDNSRKGYEGAAYESLGLVTRFWHSQMVDIVDCHLREVFQEAVSYFWHGVGRAHYFLPIFFVPGLLSPWIVIEREAPDEMALLNMIAGLAWATAIVNVRQPQIMESLLRRQGERISRTPAFTNGVVSTLMMGIDITPDDVYILEFLRYRPSRSNERVSRLWNDLIVQPASDALQRIYPVLRQHERLGELFHYQNLWELTERLNLSR